MRLMCCKDVEDGFRTKPFVHVSTSVSPIGLCCVSTFHPSCETGFNLARWFEGLFININFLQTKPHYHFASTSHLIKTKIWQNIAILIPLLQTDKCENVARNLVELLSRDMQSSVRHLMEWSLVLLLFRWVHSLSAFNVQLLSEISSNNFMYS